jgi:hypothetical protein
MTITGASLISKIEINGSVTRFGGGYKPKDYPESQISTKLSLWLPLVLICGYW